MREVMTNTSNTTENAIGEEEARTTNLRKSQTKPSCCSLFRFSILQSLTKRELKAYVQTPLGLVFLTIFLFGIGYMTFEPGRGSFFHMRQADLSSFFRYIPWMFLFLVPAISMRLWAEERRTGTIELLLTMPITITEAVLGKFIAGFLFISFALFGTFPMVLTVAFLGEPDWGPIFLGYLGSLLMGGAFLAIGSFFSALTKSQVTSFILSVVVSVIFLLAGSPPVLEFISALSPYFFVEIFESLSLLNHFESMGRGVLRIGDLWYFTIMLAGWIVGCIFLLEKKKAS